MAFTIKTEGRDYFIKAMAVEDKASWIEAITNVRDSVKLPSVLLLNSFLTGERRSCCKAGGGCGGWGEWCGGGGDGGG
jgi:hypothetical protein